MMEAERGVATLFSTDITEHKTGVLLILQNQSIQDRARPVIVEELFDKRCIR